MSAFTGQTLLNQYRVEEFVALTPLGDLYRAADVRSEKSFALTLLPKTIYENAEALKEIEAEENKLRGVAHPNLIPYLGLYQTPTVAFLLEEWIDGPSLREIFAAKIPLSVGEALIYVKAVCGALEALHKNNYLHLNLAPELIRVNKNSEIFLFGGGMAQPVGKKSTRKLNKHSRPYAAPEQFNAQALTPAADIYALAVILYELVTAAWLDGKSEKKNAETIRKTHLELAPVAPIALNARLPDHFSRMILWALRKKSEDRLKTTIELLSALALAAHISADEIPLRANPEAAPVTDSILGAWKFLPLPNPTLLSQDSSALQDRLAALTEQPKKKTRIGFASVFVFIIFAGLISLFWFVRPAPPVEISIPATLTPFASNYTPPPTITPSPKPTDIHGGRIAFTCSRGDYNQLCMVNRDGTGLAQLTDITASNYYPVFTPDGESLLFASNRNGAFDLYTLVFGEKQLVQLTQNVGNVVSPDYSPDGRQIVFANLVGDGTTAIWMVNADGLNPHLVYAGTNTIVAVAWSPDGKKIAYAMSVGIPQEYEIFTMDADGKNHIQLSQKLQGIGGSVDWSPDSKNILIYAGAYGDKDIFRLDAVTGAATQITDGGNNAGASYSPDGKYIVFNSLRNDNQADLYIMRANGDNQVQLTNNPEPDWGAQWTE